jgi:hypothetical protein
MIVASAMDVFLSVMICSPLVLTPSHAAVHAAATDAAHSTSAHGGRHAHVTVGGPRRALGDNAPPRGLNDHDRTAVGRSPELCRRAVERRRCDVRSVKIDVVAPRLEPSRVG